MKLQKITINRWLILLCLAGLLGVSSMVLGQLAVVSTIPADGATNVSSNAMIEIIFSAPLDTSARFTWPPDFFLGLIISPDTLGGRDQHLQFTRAKCGHIGERPSNCRYA